MAQFHCNFYSYSLGYPVEIEVTIPSIGSCEKGSNMTHIPAAKFPVMYLLHGHGNDYKCWLRYTSAERYAEEHWMALVTCSVDNKCYQDTSETNENYFQFISKELPEFVTSYFPISTRPEDTYMCGYSMGGYGTILHTFLEPEKYCAVGFFSPGVGIPTGTHMPGTTIQFDTLQLAKDALAAGKKLPEIFMCIGDQDFLYEAVTKYHQDLLSLGIEHRYDDLPGYEHEFSIWDKELEEFMNWIPRTDYYVDKVPHKI